jgi:hypothetical protein
MPGTRRLLEAIDSLAKQPNRVRGVDTREPLRPFQVSLLLQITLEEGSFHIHLMDLHIKGGSNVHESTKGGKTQGGSKGFKEVYALNLREPLGHIARFETRRLTMRSRFDNIMPFPLDHLFVRGTRDILECARVNE